MVANISDVKFEAAKAKVTDNPEPSRLINVDDVQAGDIVSIERIPVQIHSCERRARYNHITIFSQALWGDFTIRRSVFTREVFNQIGLYYTKREISHGVFPPLVPGSFFLFNTSRYYKVVRLTREGMTCYMLLRDAANEMQDRKLEIPESPLDDMVWRGVSSQATDKGTTDGVSLIGDVLVAVHG